MPSGAGRTAAAAPPPQPGTTRGEPVSWCDMSKVLTRLRASLDDLTPVLKRVARYVLDHPEVAIYHSVTELAEATQSSEGSIIRFCQDLGYSGFQEFKLTLAVELDPRRRPNGLVPVEDAAHLMARIADQAAVTLRETSNLFEPRAFQEVAERLARARRIDVYGVGASGVVAQYFAYKLIRLGRTVQAFVDLHLGSMSASNLAEDCVAIGVSSSGSTVDTLKALQAARVAGAYTVAVTNRLKSPLAKHADQNLLASPPESPLTGGDVFAKIGQLLVLEALVQSMVGADLALRESVQRTAQVVADKSL
jgi:RpiR family transcriptional regulator, carbohydrate utilization regulator